MNCNRKDFSKIAKIFKDAASHGDGETLHYLANDIAYLLNTECANFNKEAFLKECGVIA